jgi:hypothetical protein
MAKRGTRKSNRRGGRGRSSNAKKGTRRKGARRSTTKGRRSKGCASGEIKIERKGYTTRRGTRVPPTEFCIKDRGRPGRTSRGAEKGPYSEAKGFEPWIQEEGSLGKGFLTKMSFEKQKAAVNRAFGREKKEHRDNYEAAYRSTLGKIMVFNRSTELRRKYGKKIDKIRDWFVDEYGAESKRWPQEARAANLVRLKNSLMALPRSLR